MRPVYAAYGILGLLLWPVPLLNVLQVEAAAVVAFVSFFVAGWSAITQFQTHQAPVRSVLARQEAALLLPLAMLLAAQLWAPNCTVGQGLLFYVLFPGITVVLAVALAYALTGDAVSRPFFILAAIGLLVSIIGPVYDLGFHPQFYTYNHVFGGVLGPIYDEQLSVRPGLFVFRGLTLLWAVGALLIGAHLRGWNVSWGLLAVALGIAGLYSFSGSLGMNSPASHLQAQLGGHIRSPHFDIYYDPDRLEEPAVEALADDHEAHYRHLQDRLGLGAEKGPERIQSYLYPNPDVKARLTGARYTSVSPVWLSTPQVHLLVDRADASLGHELAHVFSRPYGLPVLRASWAPGLVEGWAVALEPPDPGPSSHDLVRVATTSDTTNALSRTAEDLSTRLTPWGFWTGRGAVSYATMGSFVRFLLDTYGPDRLKQVYATGAFASVYGRSLQSLAGEWAEMLRQRPLVSRAAHEVMTRRFTRPSLFEKECPHYVPPHRRHVQEARRAGRRGDSTDVTKHLHRALTAAPQYVPAHAALARRRLAQGRLQAVRQQLDTLNAASQSWEIRLLQGDAEAAAGDVQAAQKRYEQALDRLPRSAHETRARVLLRYAVAGRPSVMRVLTGDGSAHEQAESLAERPEADAPAVRSWRALRMQDAHQYARADSLWRHVASPLPADRPRSWHTAYAIQQGGWQSRAAYRARRYEAAATHARRAAERAAAHGALDWADAMQAWAERALRRQREDVRLQKEGDRSRTGDSGRFDSSTEVSRHQNWGSREEGCSVGE